MYNLDRIPETSLDELQTNGCRNITNSDGSCKDKASTKKIILYIDLNNTILVSDAVTSQGSVAALEYFLTTVTWGRMTKGKTFRL